MLSLTLSNWLNLLIQLLINNNERSNLTRYSSHKNVNNLVFCILFDMISNPMIGHIEICLTIYNSDTHRYEC